MAYNGQVELKVSAPNTRIYDNFYVRLVVCDSWMWNIYDTFNRSLTANSTDEVWTTRTYGNPPTITWNQNSLLYGRTGFTAISPIGWGPGSPTQVTVTALTRRHGYARGHGMGGPDGLRLGSEFVGKTIWFKPADGDPVPATICAAYVRNPENHGNVPPDWTVVMFNTDLPDSITPIPLVMLSRTYGSPVTFRTGQTTRMSANMPPFTFHMGGHDDLSRPPFNVQDTFIGGDSGAPNLIPKQDGQLVFIGGTSTTLGTEIQTDINALCTHMGVSNANYQLNWLPVP
jgi:hypothetical protein